MTCIINGIWPFIQNHLKQQNMHEELAQIKQQS